MRKKHSLPIFISTITVLLICCGCGGTTDIFRSSSETVHDTVFAEEAPEPEHTAPVNVPDSSENLSTKSAVSEEEPAPAREPEIITFTVTAAGDCSLGNLQIHGYAGTFREMYDQMGPAYFLQNVKDIFADDDMTIVNFEGVLTDSTDLVQKEFNIKGDAAYIEILNLGDVEAVSFGNNHRMDYGQEGSDDTVRLFEENDIAYAYDENVGIYESRGIRVGFVSVNEVYDGVKVETYLENGIKQLQEENVNLIIACCHWGIELDKYPNDYQQQLGKKCIDWGADLVLGCHPHVLQGVEVYDGKFIVYSMGNFCFGGNKNPKRKETMIFRQTFTFMDGVKQEDLVANVIPCYISSEMSRNDFCPTPATGKDYTAVLDMINTLSKPFELEFDQNGCYIDPSKASLSESSQPE